MNASEFRTRRIQAGLSYRRAARTLGCSLSSVYRWEHGRPIPSTIADTLRRLARAAGRPRQKKTTEE